MMAYTPERGDFIWIQFTPQAGHEQAGHEQAGHGSALVVSPRSYNGKVGLALCCPVTSQIKGYPFEVTIPAELNVSGVVLADQVRSLDWRSRQASFICRASDEVVAEVVGKLQTLLG